MAYDLTISGVSCSELHDGSGKESFDLSPENKTVSATRVFLCDWANRYTLINGILNNELRPNHKRGFMQ